MRGLSELPARFLALHSAEIGAATGQTCRQNLDIGWMRLWKDSSFAGCRTGESAINVPGQETQRSR